MYSNMSDVQPPEDVEDPEAENDEENPAEPEPEDGAAEEEDAAEGRLQIGQSTGDRIVRSCHFFSGRF